MESITISRELIDAKERELFALKQAFTIMNGGQAIEPSGDGVKRDPWGPKPPRPGYMEKAVAILREAGRPMSPATIRKALMAKYPELGNVRRQAIERAFHFDLKRKPGEQRVKRVGEKGEGLYWIAGEAVPAIKGAKGRKSA